MSNEIWKSKWILILDSGERGIIRLKKREYRTLEKNNDKSRVLYPLFMFSQFFCKKTLIDLSLTGSELIRLSDLSLFLDSR